MRLGDLDALAENLKLLAKHEDEWRQGVILGVVSTVRNTKTIDAVPVVRCAECIHRTHDGSGKPYCLALEMYLNKELDFFCSYGERRDGE